MALTGACGFSEGGKVRAGPLAPLTSIASIATAQISDDGSQADTTLKRSRQTLPLERVLTVGCDTACLSPQPHNSQQTIQPHANPSLRELT